MASVRQSRGRLFLDYRANGTRQRAYVKLSDTPENQKYLQGVAHQVDATLARGGDVTALLIKLNLLEPEQPALPTEAELALVAAAPMPRASAPVAQAVATQSIQRTPEFSTFAELWNNEFKVGWRKTYITTVRGILDKYLIPTFGKTPIAEITRAQILELRSKLAQSKGRRAGTTLSAARINTVMLILRQVLTEGADRYEFTVPMARLRPLKIPKSDVFPFTLEQSHLLINKIRADYRDYMKVRLFTGMRSGEIHGLKWKYVDFDRRIILVREAFVGGEDEYTKTDASQRDIQMSQVVYDALKSQFEATGRQAGYVFCNRKGEPLDTNNFTKRVWYPLLRHLCMDLRRPYQTRHTAATLWLASGEAPEWIALQMGHASTEMLFRVYSRYVPNLTRRDGSAFDRLLNNSFSQGTPAKGPEADAQPPPQGA